MSVAKALAPLRRIARRLLAERDPGPSYFGKETPGRFVSPHDCPPCRHPARCAIDKVCLRGEGYRHDV